MPKKIILVPGWMHSVAFYKKYEGLDIWLDKGDWGKNEDCEWVVGHCAGAVIALNKYRNKNVKFILVNPMLPQRSFWQWVKRWLSYLFMSKEVLLNDKKMIRMNYVRGILKFIETAKVDAGAIIRKIPKENIYVVRGKKDKYFCDDEAAEIIKSLGIKLIEIENAAHSWNEKFDQEIEKIITSS